MLADLTAKEEELHRLKTQAPSTSRDRSGEASAEDKALIEELRAQVKANEAELTKVEAFSLFVCLVGWLVVAEDVQLQGVNKQLERSSIEYKSLLDDAVRISHFIFSLSHLSFLSAVQNHRR